MKPFLGLSFVVRLGFVLCSLDLRGGIITIVMQFGLYDISIRYYSHAIKDLGGFQFLTLSRTVSYLHDVVWFGQTDVTDTELVFLDHNTPTYMGTWNKRQSSYNNHQPNSGGVCNSIQRKLARRIHRHTSGRVLTKTYILTPTPKSEQGYPRAEHRSDRHPAQGRTQSIDTEISYLEIVLSRTGDL